MMYKKVSELHFQLGPYIVLVMLVSQECFQHEDHAN